MASKSRSTHTDSAAALLTLIAGTVSISRTISVDAGGLAAHPGALGARPHVHWAHHTPPAPTTNVAQRSAIHQSQRHVACVWSSRTRSARPVSPTHKFRVPTYWHQLSSSVRTQHGDSTKPHPRGFRRSATDAQCRTCVFTANYLRRRRRHGCSSGCPRRSCARAPCAVCTTHGHNRRGAAFRSDPTLAQQHNDGGCTNSKWNAVSARGSAHVEHGVDWHQPRTSCALGGADESGGEGEEVIDMTSRIGARAGRRPPGSGGVREERTRGDARNQVDRELLSCVSRVADQFQVMANAVAGDGRANIEEVVRGEVTRALEPTLKSVEEMKSMLDSFMNR